MKITNVSRILPSDSLGELAKNLLFDSKLCFSEQSAEKLSLYELVVFSEELAEKSLLDKLVEFSTSWKSSEPFFSRSYTTFGNGTFLNSSVTKLSNTAL
jgi:hypothetical protein